MRLKHVFIGYDHRQPVSYSVLDYSIRKYLRRPVAITPLVIDTLPLERQGLTPFTFTRFLVPYLMGYQGWAVFLDIDMLLRADINELFEFADDDKAIMVSKNRHRFEWASVMLMNCARLEMLTPEFVAKAQRLHTLEFLEEGLIGDLPAEWNHLVGYDPPNPSAKLVHYTQGVPAFPETSDSEFAREWQQTQRMVNATVPWKALMGRSVHAVKVGEDLVPRYKVEQQGGEDAALQG